MSSHTLYEHRHYLADRDDSRIQIYVGSLDECQAEKTQLLTDQQSGSGRHYHLDTGETGWPTYYIRTTRRTNERAGNDAQKG